MREKNEKKEKAKNKRGVFRAWAAISLTAICLAGGISGPLGPSGPSSQSQGSSYPARWGTEKVYAAETVPTVTTDGTIVWATDTGSSQDTSATVSASTASSIILSATTSADGYVPDSVIQNGNMLIGYEKGAEWEAAWSSNDEEVQRYRALFLSLQDALDRWNGQPQIVVDVLQAGIHGDDMAFLYPLFMNTHPQYFFVREWEHKLLGSTVSEVIISCDTSYTPLDVDTFQDEAGKLIGQIPDGSSDEEKLLYIHDRIVRDTIPAEDGDSAYDALIVHKATSNGYALLFRYFLDVLGIDSRLITCNATKTAWNQVLLPGGSAYVDCWSDDQDATIPGTCDHSSFLKSLDVFPLDGKEASAWANEYGNMSVASTNRAYDDKWWSTASAPIAVFDGQYAYIDKDTATVYLVAPGGGTPEKLMAIPGSWHAPMGTEPLIDGCYGSLATCQGYLLVSGPETVYIAEPDSHEVRELYHLTAGNGSVSGERTLGCIYSIWTAGKMLYYDIKNSPVSDTDYIMSQGIEALLAISEAEETIATTGASVSSYEASITINGTEYPIAFHWQKRIGYQGVENIPESDINGMVPEVGSSLADGRIVIKSIRYKNNTKAHPAGKKKRPQIVIRFRSIDIDPATRAATKAAVKSLNREFKKTGYFNIDPVELGAGDVRIETRQGNKGLSINSIYVYALDRYLGKKDYRLFERTKDSVTIQFKRNYSGTIQVSA